MYRRTKPQDTQFGSAYSDPSEELRNHLEQAFSKVVRPDYSADIAHPTERGPGVGQLTQNRELNSDEGKGEDPRRRGGPATCRRRLR